MKTMHESRMERSEIRQEQPVYDIQLIDVDKVFNCEKVLDGINLSVERGKTLIITGGSGQGKSVIMKHMMGLMKPDAGRVMVLGEDITCMNDRQLRHVRNHYGVLFQSVALFDSMTVFENIALPLRERTRCSENEVRERVTHKLERVGFRPKEIGHKYPAQLSGGMKKRVGLARALVLDPKIVFFDEPTTGLDTRRSNEMYQLFYQTQIDLGYTAVIVSHDVPKIFKLADHVALLADKKIQGMHTPVAFQRSENPWVRAFVESTMGHIYTTNRYEGVL